ncbi:hypothetical protein V1478_014724 [Vespula squamosa]|uniref:Uncharacterized protein n=1 Tax=Vespula squamosa TaxID=30214 RepID=A0ABD2A3R6_VESSQ
MNCIESSRLFITHGFYYGYANNEYKLHISSIPVAEVAYITSEKWGIALRSRHEEIERVMMISNESYVNIE